MPLNKEFFDRIKEISASVGLPPEDLLAVMYYESGLNPEAHNKRGNASGLIQFMPDTLSGLGWEGGHEKFRKLDANQQLEYVERYIQDKAKYIGGKFKSGAQYYVANLWPVALKLPGVRSENPNTVILRKNPKKPIYPGVSLKQEALAYKENISLDVNQDGKITFGDLQAVVDKQKRNPNFRRMVSSFVSVPEKPRKKPSRMFGSKSYIDKFLDLLKSILNKIAEEKTTINKYGSEYPENKFVIKVFSNSDFSSMLEFARIWVLASEEELDAKSKILSDGKNIEIECSINADKDTGENVVSELSASLSDTFFDATKKIGGIKVHTIVANKTSDYQELDIKIANINYRKFQLKFLG